MYECTGRCVFTCVHVSVHVCAREPMLSLDMHDEM